MTQTLINQVQEALLKALEGAEEISRVRDLMANGPRRVEAVDVRLAQKGWVEIFDDRPGNESVDAAPEAWSFYAEHLIKQGIEKLTRTERARLRRAV